MMLTNKQYIGALGVIAALSIIGLWDSSTPDEIALYFYDDDIISRQLLEAGSLTTLQESPPVSCLHNIMYKMCMIYHDSFDTYDMHIFLI